MSIENGRSSIHEYRENNSGKIRSAAVSFASDPLRPETNADSYLYLPQMGDFEFAGVFDGAGKTKQARRASEIAKSSFNKALSAIQPYSRNLKDDDVKMAIEDGFEFANRTMRDYTDRFGPKNDEEKKAWGIATTATVIQAALINGERKIFIGHAGDSRAYVLFSDGSRFVTHDESYVEHEVRTGGMTSEQAEIFQKKIDDIEKRSEMEEQYWPTGELYDPNNARHAFLISLNQKPIKVADVLGRRRFLYSAVADSRYRAIREPKIDILPADNAYAVGLFTDGVMDNSQSSFIINALEQLQDPTVRPAVVLKQIMDDARSAGNKPDWPKVSNDDATGIILSFV